MKHLFFVFLLAALMSACADKSASTGDAKATAAVANKTLTFAVEGMTCNGCENTVQEAVTKIEGVTSVKASHLDSTAVVSFDTTLTTTTIIGNAITEAGYVVLGEKMTSIQAQSK